MSLEPGSTQAKQAAKQCLMTADRYLKDSLFQEAKTEVEKAKKLDPANVYVLAFLDRISHFEKEKKKEDGNKPVTKAHVQTAPPPPVQPKPVQQPRQTVPPVIEKKVSPLPDGHALSPSEPQRPPRVETQRHPEGEEKRSPDIGAKQPLQSNEPSQPRSPKPQSIPPLKPKEIIPPVIEELVQPAVPEELEEPSPVPAVPSERAGEVRQQFIPPPPPKSEVDEKLDEMRRQIEMLTAALEQEKKAREEIKTNQLQTAIAQLRSAMEMAWVNGAPEEKEANALHDLARTLGITENVELTIRREVKLEMYSTAVKEVVSKRQLLRSSSSTLDWLRKVYQISLEEYLEYESKFLLDLVADQYKGTLFQITSDEQLRKDLTPRLKSQGYAVVMAVTAEDALEKIEKINPNVIVCDMEFGPGNLSGIKFLHVLRANTKFNFIPFILLCSKQDVQQLQTSELRRNEGFIEKPVDFDELTTLMNEKLIHFREYISSLG
jgi:Response regulator receiver domain